MNTKEKNLNQKKVVSVVTEMNQIVLEADKMPAKRFTFDSVYGADSKQEDVYNEIAFPLVESVIKGYNGTIFAYGQTGCGKTFTMEGVRENPEMMGIIPRAFSHIFNSIDSQETGKVTYLVRCSYLEIYMEEIRDLLGNDPTIKMELKEDANAKIYVKNLTNLVVKSSQEIYKIMEKGSKSRKTAQTEMNADSSRSHSIFIVNIESEEIIQDKECFKVGKLNLVDLAGSERQSKTHAEGDRLEEAKKINLSLSALGNVISALVDGKSTHIPYRDSKLTRLLQDSLGGNTKTVMIAALSPAEYNYDETTSTLRYANRAKQIKNKPTINEDPKDALLREYQDEIKRLKEMLNDPKSMKQAMSTEGSPMKRNSVKEDFESTHHVQISRIQEEKEAIKREKENMMKMVESEKERAENLKNEMMDKVSLMEHELIKGGEALNKAEKEKEKQKYALQKALIEQKQKEEALIKEKLKKEEEYMMVEQRFNNAEEELANLRPKVKQLQSLVKSMKSELRDIGHEHEYEKEQYLNNLRNVNRDHDFFKQIVAIALTPDELLVIKKKATYNEIENSWKIPKFVLRNQKVVLPKLNNAQFNDLKAQDAENRELDFGGDEQYNNQNINKKRGEKDSSYYSMDQHYTSQYSNNFSMVTKGTSQHANKYNLQDKENYKFESKGSPGGIMNKPINAERKDLGKKLKASKSRGHIKDDEFGSAIKTEGSVFSDDRPATRDTREQRDPNSKGRSKNSNPNNLNKVKLEPISHDRKLEENDPISVINKKALRVSHENNKRLPPMELNINATIKINDYYYNNK